MSSLSITAEIKAPRLCLIETQEIKALSCLWQNTRPQCLGRPLFGPISVAGFAFREPGLTHITSRRVLISESDNNYQEEYTQNDFFCDFYASPTQGKGDNGTMKKGRVSKGSPWSCVLRLNLLCYSGVLNKWKERL